MRILNRADKPFFAAKSSSPSKILFYTLSIYWESA